MSHYDVLGIPHSADRTTIQAAYRRQVSHLKAQLQRTRFVGSRQEAERRLYEVEEAHHVLADSRRRLAYDLSLIPEHATAGRGGAGPDQPPAPQAEPTVRSVQWAGEPRRQLGDPPVPLPTTAPPHEHFEASPMPATAPPPEPGRWWNWRWVAVIAVIGLIAFVTALALITGGLRPVVIGPPVPGPAPNPSVDVIPPGPISPAGP